MEIVSSFTYYAHISYISTGGGRIRAVSGNSSYGKVSMVAFLEDLMLMRRLQMVLLLVYVFRLTQLLLRVEHSKQMKNLLVVLQVLLVN